MERSKFDSPNFHSQSTNGVRFAPSPSSSQSDYSTKAVQDALQHLASIDLIDLCNEAKVERCRASRDLRNCGRLVDSVLTSCGHASLCAECSQRYENCPICRTPIPKNGNILQPRLYHECVEAGLISKGWESRFQEKEDVEAYLTADVQRLYSLFDVALENNLCCLICHYVTDVCMDESAVSSDPVISFLLDEVVVKDWCNRTFKTLVKDVRGIYNSDVSEMKAKLGSLLEISAKLSGLCNVLEVLDLSFKDTQSAKLDDVHLLQEAILKTKQHMEMMIWCIRHDFLEGVKSHHKNYFSWRAHHRERKSAAVNRGWPEPAELSGESTGQGYCSLFIEDALLNLEVDKGHGQPAPIELEIASLLKDGGSSLFRSKIEGLGGFYPFENIRAAVDVLFFCGGSDMVVAKRAIFLYYLFDRQWTIADDEWSHIVNDFALTFSVTRHSLLESFTYYLLDDHTDEALQEACRLLPEISGPESHPKIAKVLLERQNPDAALMFLRWSGRDTRVDSMSLSEAVTAVRVRVECALLTESFMYQRTVCSKVKEEQSKLKLPVDGSGNLEGETRRWTNWVEVLVTEICSLCIRRNWVDRLIELPWNSDEERHLHKCLLDYATADPCQNAGSLLVVYYLQRHRYIEAYHIDRKLCALEEDFLSKNNVDETVLDRIKSAAHWRSGLVSKSLELLPEVEQQQLKAGGLPEDAVSSQNEIDFKREAPTPGQQDQQPTAVSSSSSSMHSSLLFPTDRGTSFRSSLNSALLNLDGYSRDTQSDLVNHASPSISHGKFFTPSERSPKIPFNSAQKFKVDVKRTPSRFFQGDLHQETQLDDELPLAVEQNGGGLYGNFPKVSPPNSRRVMAKPETTPVSNRGLLDDSPQDRYKTAYGKRLSPGEDPGSRPRSSGFSADAMDISWSQEENGSPATTNLNASGVQRWRSDETSDEEELPSPEKLGFRALSSHTTPVRKSSRRVRLSRR